MCDPTALHNSKSRPRKVFPIDSVFLPVPGGWLLSPRSALLSPLLTHLCQRSSLSHLPRLILRGPAVVSENCKAGCFPALITLCTAAALA